MKSIHTVAIAVVAAASSAAASENKQSTYLPRHLSEGLFGGTTKQKTEKSLKDYELRHYNPFPDELGGISIGEHHNRALEYFAKNGEWSKDAATLDYDIDMVTKYAIEAGLIEEDHAKEMEDQVVATFGPEEKVKQAKGEKEKLIAFLAVDTNPAFGGLFTDTLHDLIDITGNGRSYDEQIMASLDLINESIVPLADAGDVQAMMFVDVFSSSLEYWSGFKQGERRLQGDCEEMFNTGLIMADALGAIGGGFFGPIAGIIAGAVASVAFNVRYSGACDE